VANRPLDQLHQKFAVSTQRREAQRRTEEKVFLCGLPVPPC
jgi:hypothetical protein